jgi:hypothetical protein
VEPVGQVEVVTLATSTKTLIAEGLASHNSYKYADIADIWEAIREPLHANGLAVSQSLSGGAKSGSMWITTTVLHKSGQCKSSTIDVAIGERTPQEVGSQLTYFKRYALTSELGISTEEDDDGAAASSRERGQERVNGQSDEAREEAARAARADADEVRGEILRRLEPLGWTGDKLIERFAKDYGGEDLLKILDHDRIRKFGDALWDESKQTDTDRHAAEESPPADPAEPVAEQADSTPELISPDQLRRLHILLTQDKLTTNEKRRSWCADMIGRPLESTKDITKAEAIRLISQLDPPQ